ncbi:SAM-dependent methyltransferase [Paractinoplanes globisporus]|uniref:SAM-dependent methyltransferase n=1 Tax=Paractinoplanes globisporus TaxID=113565 RepID=A0ABW6WUX5_9ACTN|nr:SAM-dependent methyltransferase [Actinoplanes globisporus]
MSEAQYDFDTSVAHPARVYDYWLGGKDNFEADRKAAEEVIAVRPSILYDIRANREFLGRAVSWLASVAGIRQFLDIGTGIPAAGNTHQVAQRIDPAARIVYVDNDPIVLVHARALLTGTDAGATAYIDGDLRDPAPILATARRTLDFDRPIAVQLIGVLHLIADEENPKAIIDELMAAVPAGSYLAITQPASDVNAEQAAAGAQRYNSKVATKQTRRTREQTAAFLDGLEIVEPGVVQCHRWRPEPGADVSREVSGWAAVARKP